MRPGRDTALTEYEDAVLYALIDNVLGYTGEPATLTQIGATMNRSGRQLANVQQALDRLARYGLVLYAPDGKFTPADGARKALGLWP